MRLTLLIGGLVIFLFSVFIGDRGQIGPSPAEAFNPLKYCVDKCVLSGSASISQCKKDECSGLKSKSKISLCERRCNKPGGLLKFCDTTCKQSQMCTAGLEMKSCLKKNCDPYKKSDIRRYITCKNEECGSICKNG